VLDVIAIFLLRYLERLVRFFRSVDDLIIEALENRKRTPEYEGYYKRMDDFLRRQTPEFVTDFKGETVG
jgi:hypothetical protein